MCRGQKIPSVSEQFSSKLESNIFHGFILQPNKMGWECKNIQKSENERELGNTLKMKKIHPPTSEIGKEWN